MPQDVQTTDPAATPDAAAEHLSHLHKMSTTAGVTNQDYVAVNPLAVVAALLGLASGLAFAGWLLLVVPVVGIVFAVVAIRQINDSNGTQTGKGFAILGLALCVLCAGGMMVRKYMDAAAVRSDEQAIAAAITQTGRLIGGGDYKQAYAQFDQAFHANVTYEEFRRLWETIQSSQVGKLQKMEWNGVRPAFGSAEGSATAAVIARLKFEKANEERYDVMLRKVGGKWLINSMPQFFRPRGQQRKAADDFNI